MKSLSPRVAPYHVRSPTPDKRTIDVAVPGIAALSGRTGIGRVFCSLRERWADRVCFVGAELRSLNVPVLRNFPHAVDLGAPADLVLLPKLTGAQALRSTNGVPSLIIVHDIGVVDFPGDRQGMDRIAYRSVLQSFRSLRYATGIVAVSNFTAARLVEHVPQLRDRVSVIPNGIDPVFQRARSSRIEACLRVERLLGRAPGTPLLVSVGSEAPRKNVALLLQVFAELRRFHPGAQLIKVGAPGQARWRDATLRHADRLGLRAGAELVLLDQLDDPQLADVYAAADVFVSTSLYEGFGLPALEAMAAGAPVVVTTAGSFAENVANAGWVVPPTLGAMVPAVLEAVAGGGQEERKALGYARAAQFDWSTAAERYLALMQRLAGAGHHKGSYA